MAIALQKRLDEKEYKSREIAESFRDFKREVGRHCPSRSSCGRRHLLEKRQRQRSRYRPRVLDDPTVGVLTAAYISYDKRDRIIAFGIITYRVDTKTSLDGQYMTSIRHCDP